MPNCDPVRVYGQRFLTVKDHNGSTYRITHDENDVYHAAFRSGKNRYMDTDRYCSRHIILRDYRVSIDDLDWLRSDD